MPAMPSQDIKPRESSPGSTRPRSRRAHQDARTAPQAGASTEPISSSITCTEWGQGSPARHGSASWAEVGGSRRAVGTTVKDREAEDGEPPELPTPARMEPAKLPLTKRMAPAPPVPAKAKPVPVLATKPADPQPSATADPGWGRNSDPDTDGFNAVSVTTARLSHPTATRPRVPGQRPPSLVLGSAGGPCGEEQPWGPPQAGLCVPVPSAGQAEGPEGRLLALEDLKAEVRTLHILVDLMRVQHLRDLQDLRLELCQERSQRQALQAEIERVRKGLPC